MTIWVIILTFLVRIADIDVIAQHSQWLFTTEADCIAARPALETHAPQLAPTGYAVPLTPTLTLCISQRVVSVAEVIEHLNALPPAAGK